MTMRTLMLSYICFFNTSFSYFDYYFRLIISFPSCKNNGSNFISKKGIFDKAKAKRGPIVVPDRIANQLG